MGNLGSSVTRADQRAELYSVAWHIDAKLHSFNKAVMALPVEYFNFHPITSPLGSIYFSALQCEHTHILCCWIRKDVPALHKDI